MIEQITNNGFVLRKRGIEQYLCQKLSFPFYYTKDSKEEGIFEEIKIWKTKKRVEKCLINPNHGAWYTHKEKVSLFSCDFEIVSITFIHTKELIFS